MAKLIYPRDTDLIDKIILMYRNGISFQEISKRLGNISVKFIKYAIKQDDFRRRW